MIGAWEATTLSESQGSVDWRLIVSRVHMETVLESEDKALLI
jgi:hypothetical protein